MSDIRFNQWLHQSGTGGITQVDGGHVGIGTTNPDVAVHSGNTKKINVGIVTANSVYAGSLYGDGSNLTSLPAQATIANNADNRVITGGSGVNLNGESNVVINSGKLGIGVASPNQLIEVHGASNPAVLVQDTTNNCISYMYSQDSVATFGSASNHPVVFNVNNSEKLRITSNGNIGLGGVTSPLWTTGGGMHLNDAYGIGFGNGGSGRPDFQIACVDGSKLEFRCGFGADTADIVMNTSGYFGVGTNNPSYKTQLSVSDTTAYSASTISANQFQLAITNSGAAGVAGILLATEPSSGNGGHCGIRALSTGNGDSALTFSTRGSSTSAERLRIDSSGQVSIGGNSSVGTKLHIENSSGDAHIRVRGSANCGVLYTRHSDGALIGYTGSGNAVNLGSSNLGISASLSGGNIVFQTNGTASSDERLRIESGGEIRLLSANGNNSDTPGFTFRGGNSSQKANFARIHSRMVSNWGGQLQFKVKDDNGSLSDAYQTAMIMDHNGQVTKPNHCCFEVALNGDQSFTSGTRFKINFNYVHNQQGTTFDTSNNRFTAPVTGYYQFNLGVYSYYSHYMELDGRCNGASTGAKTYRPTTRNDPGGDRNPGASIMASWVVKLDANDFYEIYCNTFSSHGVRNIYSDLNRNPTWWSGYLVC